MIRAPHPALRRLFALGTAPGRAAGRLERPLPRLTALARDHGDLPVLSDRVLEPLVRGIDLARVAECVVSLDTAAPPAAIPSDAADGASATVLSTIAGPERRPGAVEPPSPPSPAPRREPPGTAAGSRPPRPDVPRHLADVAGADAKAAPGPDAGGAPGAAPPPPLVRSAAPRARSLIDGDRARIAPAQATATLRDRATRAGSPTSADTPLGAGEATGAAVTILERAQPQTGAAPGRESITATSAFPLPRGEARPPKDSGLAWLARSVERVTASGPRREVVAGRSHPRPRPPAVAADGDEGPAPPAPAASTEGPRGLRGLAARLAASPAATVPAPGPGAPDRESAVPALVAERVGEAELARRITQVLRREARRQGIDVGLVEP